MWGILDLVQLLLVEDAVGVARLVSAFSDSGHGISLLDHWLVLLLVLEDLSLVVWVALDEVFHVELEDDGLGLLPWLLLSLWSSDDDARALLLLYIYDRI